MLFVPNLLLECAEILVLEIAKRQIQMDKRLHLEAPIPPFEGDCFSQQSLSDRQKGVSVVASAKSRW